MSKIRHDPGKERKFLTVALGILRGVLEEEGVTDRSVLNTDAQRLHDFIKLVSKDFEIGYPKKSNAPKGNFIVTTYDGSRKRTPAQVKLWKLTDNETDKDFDHVCGKIDMERFVTEFDGELSASIPYGKYYCEVSKGSEYCIIKDVVEIGPKTVNRKYHLKRFIDLSKYGWYAGDIHHHSIYSSPVYKGDDDVTESPHEVANSMAAMGLRYGALSDHHNILNHKQWMKETRSDFLPIVSKEISTSNGHVIALGAEKDVIFRIPDKDQRSDEYMRSEFKKIVNEIKENGGLAQINHPCDLSRSNSWNPSYYDMTGIFETIEIWNGSAPMIKGSTNYKAYELWLNLLKEGIYRPATTGSDTHNIKADDYNDFYILMQNIRKVMSVLKYPAYKNEIHVIDLIFKKAVPILEKWATTSLTSGCVRTYVHIKGKPTKDKVLDSLRKGESFLTNGPILFYKDNRLTLMSARKLNYLRIYTPEGLYKEKKLNSKTALKKDGDNIFYDYSCDLKDSKLLTKEWFYITAVDDCTNQAFLNPVFKQ